jgi:hypothetical protein
MYRAFLLHYDLALSGATSGLPAGKRSMGMEFVCLIARYDIMDATLRGQCDESLDLMICGE